jgi:hypothetical protein
MRDVIITLNHCFDKDYLHLKLIGVKSDQRFLKVAQVLLDSFIYLKERDKVLLRDKY